MGFITEDQMYTQGSFLGVGDVLANGKWAEWVDGIDDSHMRRCTAIMLENEQRYIRDIALASQPWLRQQLTETTLTTHPGIATLEMQNFPLIRGMLPNLVSSELVSVQPMMSDASSVFFLQFQYGTTKGATTKGTTLFDYPDKNYSSETVDTEVVGTGDGTDSPALTSLTFTAVRPGTVVITDGTLTVRDDANGGFVGNALAGAIDYDTGAITGLQWSAATDAGASISVDYEYNSEGSTDIPQIDMLLTSAPVVARKRKLRFRYSLEAAAKLQNHHGLDPEAELTAVAAEELKFEIDREIIDILFNVAAAGAVSFTKSAPVGVSYQDHKQSFIDTLVEAGQLIYRATRRAMANWVVCGTDAASIVETLPGFVPSGISNTMGVVKCGVLNGRWVIYKDPYIARDKFLVGYKGQSFLEAGFIYAPYIPLYMTDKVSLDDFIARKGLGTMYAKKVVNPRMYCSGAIRP